MIRVAALIDTIESNVKGGVKVSPKGKHCLIVGPNGSGKSAVLDAISLSMFGEVTALAGRESTSRGLDLRQLGPADGQAIFSLLTFTGGATRGWVMDPGHNPRTTGEAPDVLTYTQIRDLLCTSATKIRSQLLQAFSIKPKWQDQLTVEQQSLIGVHSSSSIFDTTERINQMLRLASTKAKELETELERALSVCHTSSLQMQLNKLRNELVSLPLPVQPPPTKVCPTCRRPIINLQQAPSRRAAIEREMGILQSQISAGGLTRDARALRTELAACVEGRDRLVYLRNDLNRIMTESVREAQAEICGAVQKWMPAGMRFGLRLTSGSNEVFELGVICSGGYLLTALSGSQWVTVLIAMGLAIAERQGKQAMVLAPEVDWDQDSLAALMVTWGKNAPGQIFLTSTVCPPVLVPGWHIHRT
jgi:ABC-type branched-subunit amino acid transport system ATPase component